MTSELVVDVQPKEVSIALLEDKQLVELQSEGRNISFSVGNMYLGRVKKLMPGLNACFVDVGYEKDAFLHYLDLGPQFNSLEKYVKQTLSDKKKLNPITKATILPDLEKDGTVSNTLKVGQEVVVQIVKEPISTKGPRLTSELSFAGRYLVLIPFNDKVSVSQKIKSSEERARLKQLLMSIKPKNFGVIVRTVAEGKRVAELDGELKVLLKHWEDAITKVQKATKFPTLIYEETSRAVGLLRDLFNPSFENIHVNNEAVYHEIKDYVTLIAPERAGIVKLYKGQLPIYDNFGITKQIKSSFGKTISYKSGAYLIIEHTEALHVVDVNSGNRTKNANGQEANALEVNLGAADELARQLCLSACWHTYVRKASDVYKRQALEQAMKENNTEVISPSMCYAYAAIAEGAPFIKMCIRDSFGRAAFHAERFGPYGLHFAHVLRQEFARLARVVVHPVPHDMGVRCV